MCGIVGCINKKNPREYIVEGLKILDYRGYDSAGIAFLNDEIQIFKDAGSVDHLNSIIPVGMSGKIAIGHTRWATHGKPSKINSHPHLSYDKKFALVHNGVIENFQDLKAELTEQGIKFVSDTDSEVILNLIALTYSKTKDVLKSINMTMKRLKGSYAIGLMHVGDDRLYVMKNATPLLIGLGESFNLISSDPSPMIEYTNKFIELDDFEYGYIEKDKVALFDIGGRKIEKEFVSKEAELIKHDLNGYKHFMLKEIEEIPAVVKRLTDAYIDDNGFKIDKELLQSIKESDHIIFLGCGTSYHASLVGGRYFEEMLEVPTASYIASEWAFHPMFPGKKPFIVFISQSGETADLIHCLKIVKERNFKSLIITNTKGSTLDRGCDYSMP